MPKKSQQLLAISYQLACGVVVKKLWKKLGKLFDFYSFSTSSIYYLASQVFFVYVFYTPFTHFQGIYRQLELTPLPLFNSVLNTQSTPSTNEAIN